MAVPTGAPRVGKSARPRRGPFAAVARWQLWQLPGPVLLLVLAADLAALGAVLYFAPRSSNSISQGVDLAILFGLSALFAEANDRLERMRRYLHSPNGGANANSMWQFAGVVALSTGYAALLIVAVYAHTFIRIRRHQSARPHRLLFTASTVVLATVSASMVLHRVDHGSTLPTGFVAVLGILLAMVTIAVVNQGLVIAVIYLMTKPEKLSDAMLSSDEQAFELATTALGVLTAATVVVLPWASPLSLVVLALIYRTTAVKQLEKAARTDAKTGLLNFTAWRDAANAELARAGREGWSVVTLVIDLDHFKQINELCGHLGGDRALAAVGACLRDELRTEDVVGRFGGDEFAVLLTNLDLEAAQAVATRVRDALCRIEIDDAGRLGASIGLAYSAVPYIDLESMLEKADVALLKAKADGRGRVLTNLA